jgi:DNA modification methylase
MTPTWEIRVGDVRDRLREMPDESVHCVVTSPPYWGLRDYGVPGQLGLEATYIEHVETMTAIFGEVRRVLRPDGTLWLNYGDTYATGAGSAKNPGSRVQPRSGYEGKHRFTGDFPVCQPNRLPQPGLKPKDLCGIPWRVAFALQDDGWYLRSDIIWHKPNPLPESVRDRPTKSHEYLFLLAKSQRYFYDAASIRERDTGQDHARSVLENQDSLEPSGGLMRPHRGLRRCDGRNGLGRNARSVWTVSTQAFPKAHFATFPEELARRCIRAGCPKAGVVLDPFAGSGTTILVALQLGRNAIGIELKPAFAELARERITKGLRPHTARTDAIIDSPLFQSSVPASEADPPAEAEAPPHQASPAQPSPDEPET